jgi:ATP-dependent DNA helicase RecQ
VNRALTRLEDQSVIERDSAGAAVLARSAARDVSQHVGDALAAQQALYVRKQARIAEMQEYARTRSCRRALLLGHFGEALAERCGGCDNCDHPLAGAA